jgi:hypothetical protein
MLSLALCMALGPAPSPDSFTLSYQPATSAILVSIKVNGQEEKVLLETGARFSEFKTAEAASKADIELGPRHIEKTKSRQDPTFQVFGQIGYDVLKDYAVGIDYFGSTVTLWPHKLSKADAEAWIGAGDRSWMPAGHPAFSECAIHTSPKGFPFVDATIEGRSLRLDLSDHIQQTFVDKISTGLTGHPRLVHMFPDVSIGGTQESYLELTNAFQGMTNPVDMLGMDGVLTLENFWSPRLIYDLAGGKVYKENVPNTVAGTMLLRQIEPLPVTVTDQSIVLGGPGGDHVDAGLLGCEIEDFGLVECSDLLSFLLHPSKGGASDFNEMLEKVGHATSVDIHMKDETQEELDFDAYAK